MNRDNVEGKSKELGGKVKEAAGRLTGDERLEAEGQTDQLKGKVQDTVGKVKDAAREGAERLRGVRDSLSKEKSGSETDREHKKRDVA